MNEVASSWRIKYTQLVCESIHSFVWNPARGSHLDYTCYEPCRRTHFSPSFKSPILHLFIGWRISNVYLNTSKCVCVCVPFFSPVQLCESSRYLRAYSNLSRCNWVYDRHPYSSSVYEYSNDQFHPRNKEVSCKWLILFSLSQVLCTPQFALIDPN